MNYNTVYVGMDVHKESFSLCAYTIEAEKASHYQRTEADYKKVLNYLEFLRTIYGDDANFICGYEAGCLGYTLYHQLTANNVKCIILAPTTMLERLDKRIEELSTQDEYKEAVKKLCCFIGVKTHTALSVLVEVGDFNRFASAQHFASYLGLVPGEDSSGNDQNRLGITKAGNRHVRLLLTEVSQCYARGQVGFKSKELKARQSGNTPAVIAYADKANERLRRRYYKMVLNKCKKHNVAKTAIARELACFMWGMMTDNIA